MNTPSDQKTCQLGLFLSVKPHAGGMFQYAQSILEALSCLDAKRYQVTIAYSDTEWSPILARLKLSGYMLRHVRTGQRIANAAMALRIPGSLSRIISRLLNPLAWELLRLHCDAWIFPAQESISYQLPVRSIGTVHDLMHRYEPSFPEVSARFRFGIREHRFRNIVSYCDAVLVDSNVGRQQVIDSYNAQVAKIHPLPYVAPSYLKNSSERVDFDTCYRLPRRFLFYPAQFWPHKNHLRLLDAMHILAQRYPDIALVFSGGKHHAYAQIRDHAEKLGLSERVHFVGYVPDGDLRGFYVRARALVMPTFFGPTNIPPLEAMSLGCPVVVSGIYGMIEQSGDAALYFDPNSTEEMAKCMEKVWSDDAVTAKMISKGFELSRHNDQSQFNRRFSEIIDVVFACPEI